MKKKIPQRGLVARLVHRRRRRPSPFVLSILPLSLSLPRSLILNTIDSPAAVSVSDPARTATEPERRATETARRDEGTATRAATRIDGDEEVVAALQVVARLLPEEEEAAASEGAAESGARREASMVCGE